MAEQLCRAPQNYDYEGGEPANLPPAGYIWTNALAAEISLRMYGVWDTNLPADRCMDRARSPQ